MKWLVVSLVSGGEGGGVIGWWFRPYPLVCLYLCFAGFLYLSCFTGDSWTFIGYLSCLLGDI